MSEIKQTPMVRQYMEVKKQYPDHLLFYRMGDFYELFYEDAKVASRVLDIVLTDKNRNKPGGPMPMCGVPFHAYESYLVKLVKAGFKVAICEQMESPEEAKKRGRDSVVKREVIRVVTAGTLTEDSLLTASKNNYLASLVFSPIQISFCWVDMSTGTFCVQSVADKSLLHSLIARLEPSEIIVSESDYQKHPDIFYQLNGITTCDDSLFLYHNQQDKVENFLSAHEIDIQIFDKTEKTAAGVLLSYLNETQKGAMPQLQDLKKVYAEQYMDIDPSTRRSLELIHSLSVEKGGKSLLSVLGRTLTGGGGRLLGSRLSAPSIDPIVIENRLNQVEFFIQNSDIRQKIRELLKGTADIERALSRLSVGRGGPKDMTGIAEALKKIPKIRLAIKADFIPETIERLLLKMGEHSSVFNRIFSAIKQDAPSVIRDGKVIREGYCAELDELRHMRENSQTLLMELQSKYIQKTGISNLKIQYNNSIGYYVEVPAKSSDIVFQNPEWGFVHRQTMPNAIRFATAELNGLAGRIVSADSESLRLELNLFEELRIWILSIATMLYEAAEAFSELDVATTIALLAEENKWVRPVITTGLDFDVKGGRHPVVESALKKENKTFVSNDCFLGTDDNRLWLLTGPNMAGKSTFLRQNALIAVMAQMGSYVPADFAKIGIVDKLFSRVGASDDLARGQSTFMVEMVEVASILSGATERSLVILDEVGRGTATFDGLSLAWAVVEYLRLYNKSRGLFATHYHELTVLANRLEGVTLHTMRVKEWQGDIVFLHEIADGATDRSYGIHVAKLAGLPDFVLERAKIVLDQLEEKKQEQKPLFDDLPLFLAAERPTYQNKPSEVEGVLAKTDIDMLSPREALDLLYRLKTMMKEN